MSNNLMPQGGNMVPQSQNQQQLNMVAYNQLDLSPGIREALLAAQAQSSIQIQQQQQILNNAPQQQMDYINSARNMMAYNQYQMRQQPPPIMQAPPQMYQQGIQPSMQMQPSQFFSQQQPQVQQPVVQQDQQQQQQQYLGQNNFFQQVPPQAHSSQPNVAVAQRVSSNCDINDPSEFDDRVEEFDAEFLLNNPGIVQTQKYFQQNYEQVVSRNMMSGEQVQPDLVRDDNLWRNMHINLANNNQNHKKKFGLNQNKRGRIIDSDFQKLQNSIRNQYSQRNEEFLNQKFKQQPQMVVQDYRQNKAKLEQQFVHRQYQNQGKILQVLSALDDKIVGISNSQNYIQSKIQNLQDQGPSILQKSNPSNQGGFSNPSAGPGVMLQQNLMQPVPMENSSMNPQQQQQKIQQDALAMIRDQVKEELKEELKNQIRQELIDQLPKESQDVLAKKGKYSSKPGPANSIGISPGVNNTHNSGSSKNASNSLNEYKFGMINDSQNDQNSNNEKISKDSKQSKQSLDDSDRLESERLRKSYDEYGKMIKNKSKKIDYKKHQMQEINEDIDQDSDNDDLEFKHKKPPMSVKNCRSSSLAHTGNQNDILSKQLDQIKQAERRKNSAKRNNSIHVGNAMQVRESKCGTEGADQHIRNFNNNDAGYFDNDNNSFDFLQIQIEDERLKMLNEIHQIVLDNREDDIDESNLNNKLKLICKNMNYLNIDYSVSKILELTKKEKRILRELIKKYQQILMHQSKYVNVEHLDNELKSDVDADYDEEEDEDEPEDEDDDDDDEENDDSSSQDPKKSSSDEVENRSNSYRGGKKKKKKKIQIEIEKEEDNSDNDVQYENYKPNLKSAIDPKAIKIREQRRGSVMSINSRRVSKQKQEEKKKISKKQFQSDSGEDDDDDDDGESISQAESPSSEESKKQELVKSPSLAEIKRSSSYCSIDSKVKKQAAKKFDPKLLKIRDDGSARGSIRSRSSKTSKKGFMQDMVSERSGNRRQLSLYRRDKLQGLELDYHQYLQQYQGIFVIRCQMMNIELSKIREKYDLEKMMVEFKNFKKLQKEIKQDEVYRGLQTVIIDIEHTFVTLIEIKNKEELDAIKEYDNFHSDYIVIKKNVGKKSKKDKKNPSKEKPISDEPDFCCEFKGTDRCICDLMVYLVRPYTYEILRAIQPFFEIVVFSKLHHKILEHIIDHIESILNKPIKEFLEKYQKSMNKSSFQRMKKLPDVKIYFQFIIHQRQYIHIKEHDKHIENLLVLTKNRPKDNLIFISSNPFRIVTAIKYGFLTIPVIQFESFYRDDYQLSLVEHYILKIRHLKDMKKRLRHDFKCLVQKIDNQPCKVPNYIKNLQAQNKFEVQSQGSFGGKKLKQKVADIKESRPKDKEKDKEKKEEKEKQKEKEKEREKPKEKEVNNSKERPRSPPPKERESRSPKNQTPVIPPKKVDPALLNQNKPQSVNASKGKYGQFKPRKSSFGNISFGDGKGKGGQRQPQSDSEDLEDYDEEECERKIMKLENEIKHGLIQEKPKKKLLFTKIEENKIDENDEKSDSEKNQMNSNVSFNKDQNQNPQEQVVHEKSQNQPDLMQYNFQVASQGSVQQNNPFQSLFRPGLKEPNEKQSSCSKLDKMEQNDLLRKNYMGSVSLSQGELENKDKDGFQSGGEAGNNAKKAVSLVIIPKVNQPHSAQKGLSAFAKDKSSSSKTSKTSSDNSVSINEGKSWTVEEQEDKVSSSMKDSRNRFSRHSHSHSQSEDSDLAPKIIQGKVIYDANKVILEESKDQSMLSGMMSISESKPGIKINKSKNRKHDSESMLQDSNASHCLDKKSSKIDSELIDDIYAQLDCEQQNAQMQKINEEIENSQDQDQI